MADIENLFSVIKNFLPLADKYLSGSPLEPYLPEIQNIINIIDSMGGISTINSFMQSFKNKNTSNIKKDNNEEMAQPLIVPQIKQHAKSINNYKRVE